MAPPGRLRRRARSSLLASRSRSAPGEWASWVDFLRDSAGESTGYVYLTPAAIYFPLVARLPLALAVAVFAARTDRRWLLPVAMLPASPVVGWGTFALLAAIPRLRPAATSDPREDRSNSDSGSRSLTA